MVAGARRDALHSINSSSAASSSFILNPLQDQVWGLAERAGDHLLISGSLVRVQLREPYPKSSEMTPRGPKHRASCISAVRGRSCPQHSLRSISLVTKRPFCYDRRVNLDPGAAFDVSNNLSAVAATRRAKGPDHRRDVGPRPCNRTATFARRGASHYPWP